MNQILPEFQELFEETYLKYKDKMKKVKKTNQKKTKQIINEEILVYIKKLLDEDAKLIDLSSLQKEIFEEFQI